MTDWATMETGLLTWFNTASGLKAVAENAERPLTTTGAILSIEVVSTEAHGIDEPRETIDEETGEVITTLCGIRHMTLRVKAESPSQAPNKRALNYINLVRAALRFPSSLEVFQGLGLAQVRTMPTVHADYAVDNRMWSRTSFDVVLAFASNSDDPVQLGTIGHVELSSELTAPSGDAYAPAIQVIDQVIPPIEELSP